MKTLIEIGAIQALFYLIYLVWLQKETDYSRKRMFLLLSTLLSVLIPFIQLPAPEAVREVSQTYGMVLPAFDYHAIQAEATDRFAWDWSEISTYTSMIVSTLFILMIGISVMQVIVMYQRSTAYAYGNRYVYSNSAIKQSFSFFNWIFSRELNPSVIAHEEAHVRLKHTYDILILQLFRAACWWSPFAWLALKEMKMIHEYQADAVAIKNHNIDEYQQLLISSTLSSMGWGLASSFHDGSLLKRLHAMKQQTKKISNWKISTLGVLVAIIALTFACEELDQDIKKMSEDSRQIGFEELPDDIQSRFKGKSEDFTYMVIYVDQSEGIKPSEKLSQLQDVDPALIESVHVVKNDKAGEVYLVLRKDAKSYGYVEEKSKASDEVFTIVEQQPEFPGGMTAFYEFIATNLEYPADAKASGLEGRVFVQFIVDTDGSLKDVKTVKGIGGGCDEEAERVLAKSPKFTPGKQRGKAVQVRMILPIVFSLGKIGSVGVGETSSMSMAIIGKQMHINIKAENDFWLGTVLDAETNKPLAGVNLIEEGTSNGTVSDLKGQFKLKRSDQSKDIIASFVGFESQRLTKESLK